VQRHLIIPVALGSMALAGAGWFVGIATGSSPASSETSITTRTVTEKGTVVSVHGAPEVLTVKKKIPARTITRNGKVITLPATTLDLVRTQIRTISRTTPGRTVTRTSPPVTVTNVVTQTQTQTVTEPGTTITITVTT
jgi:hypothetical protein